jgi:hypothetical protein
VKGFGLLPGLAGSGFAERWGNQRAEQSARELRRMPPASSKKGVAIYDDKIIIPTKGVISFSLLMLN